MDFRGIDKIPRDSWLNPVSGFEGIVDRITFDEEAVEERIASEWEANQVESRSAIQAVGAPICNPASSIDVSCGSVHDRCSVVDRLSGQSFGR